MLNKGFFSRLYLKTKSLRDNLEQGARKRFSQARLFPQNRSGLIRLSLVPIILIGILGIVQYNQAAKLITEAKQLTNQEKYSQAIEKLNLAQDSGFRQSGGCYSEQSIYFYRLVKRPILALPRSKVVGGRAAPSASKDLIIIYNALRIKMLRIFGRFFAEIRRLHGISRQIAILRAGEFRL